MILRLTSTVMLGALLGSWPAAAQNSDPFHEVAPTPGQDPFQLAPPDLVPKPAPVSRPRPPEPEPVIAAPPPPPPPPAPVAQWDGLWTGTFHCNATGALPEFTSRVTITVNDNNIERVGARSQTPGTPGYDSWTGRINPNGSATIRREATGLGLLPGTAPRGQPISQIIAGRFSGDSFIGLVPGAARGCDIRMNRAK